MKLFVSVPAPDDGTLRPEAVRAWDDFKQNIAHPLTALEPQFGETLLAAGGMAGVCVDYERNRAHIILETQLLKEGTDSEKRLTLLHECVHTDFAFGDHRERWDRRQKRCEASDNEIDEMESDGGPSELVEFIRQQRQNALTAIQLPDEIVAEQKMKRNYPELFGARAAYYLKMQRRHAAEIAAPRPGHPFWPFRVFHEVLRTSFFIPLVEDMPELRDEFVRLAHNAEERLREVAPPELIKFLLGLKPRLLNVSLDAPLTEAEAAYEQLHDRIMAVERLRPEQAKNPS